jgi:hypothetical protein
MKTYAIAILVGMVTGPAAQIICYVLRTRPGSATALILSVMIGAAVGVVVCRGLSSGERL